MIALPRRLLFAIEAVLDVAYNGGEAPVRSAEITKREGIPPRYLEPVLQALVHEGIFHGVRGPRGGYELARERRRISVADILRAAGSNDDDAGAKSSRILDDVVLPALADAERTFTAALARLSIEELTQSAEGLRER